MGRKLLLCIQYKSPISRWAMPEGRGKGQYNPYDDHGKSWQWWWWPGLWVIVEDWIKHFTNLNCKNPRVRVFSDPSSNIYNLLAPLCRFIPTRRQVPIEGFISYTVSDKWARWGILKSSGRNKELNPEQMSKVQNCRSEIMIRAKHKLTNQPKAQYLILLFLDFQKLFWDHRHNRKIRPLCHNK